MISYAIISYFNENIYTKSVYNTELYKLCYLIVFLN